MRLQWLVLPVLISGTLTGHCDGPATRVATDPHALTSTTGPVATPLPVEALLTTTRIGGVTYSNDRRLLAYISSASGRPNLWVMNLDGTGARQLIKSDDRQSRAIFTHDDSTLVYSQDKGGNEYSDIYAVPVSGGEPRNLTRTDDVSEVVDEFSPDGKLLAISTKLKTLPATNLAVMSWPDGAIRQLTNETDPKASWSEATWSRDGKYLYANRSLGIDDSDIYRVDVAAGKTEKLIEHAGKQQVRIADVSPDGGTLLITSNAKGGYENVALLKIGTKELKWLTDTQWSADAVSFTPDGGGAVYLLNADGRITTRFVNLKTGVETERGVPAGMTQPATAPKAFLPDGSLVLLHEDSSHPAELYRLAADNTFTQITHNANETLQHAVLPKSQLVTYKSFDGRMISAFVWVPINQKRDGTAAAVVMPHGGPTGQTADAFNGRAELLASRGFVVIAPNVRGSTGYGMEFQNANIKDLGGADLKDEISGVEFLKATDLSIPKRSGSGVDPTAVS